MRSSIKVCRKLAKPQIPMRFAHWIAPNSMYVNEMQQPVGMPVLNWSPPPLPSREKMLGQYVVLEPLDIQKHVDQLYNCCCLEATDTLWTYMTYGPFESYESFREWVQAFCTRDDPLFFAIIDRATEKVTGAASYLRIKPEFGSIEVGHLLYTPQLQRTPAATEAMYLMMKHIFELGYRRYEWKCNSLNLASRRAAQRLGFSFEGVFRQSSIVKGRNRDTAWYACIDTEWPRLQKAFQQWLNSSNFEVAGVQKKRLSELTHPILVRTG